MIVQLKRPVPEGHARFETLPIRCHPLRPPATRRPLPEVQSERGRLLRHPAHRPALALDGARRPGDERPPGQNFLDSFETI